MNTKTTNLTRVIADTLATHNGGIFVEVSKILEMDCSETETLGMLFSSRMDAMNVFEEGRGAVTIKAWDDLFQDLIAWKTHPKKSFIVKIKEEY